MVMTNVLRFIACLSVFCLSQASAQEYPTKVITMVVPFAAGGPTDTVARLIGAPMSKTLKQQVIVENVLGAGGTIAEDILEDRKSTRLNSSHGYNSYAVFRL